MTASSYLSLPISWTQPNRLAAMGRVFGVAAAPPEGATVLEIGCAAGGNILPLASRYRRAHFVGVDTNEQDIAFADAFARRLSLNNITFIARDISDFHPDQAFDYILCHGVYSWVDEPVQRAILHLCATALTGAGIAAISFNVLPGWRLQQAVRDIIADHYQRGGMSDVRAVLQDLGRHPPPGPYGATLARAAQRLMKRPDSYIRGEFLSHNCAPLLFDDVERAARTYGLTYLCEADLRSSSPEYLLGEPAARAARRHAGADGLNLQQTIDQFSGRPFRRSLFVRQGAQRHTDSGGLIDALSSLHFTLTNPPDPTRAPSPGLERELLQALQSCWPGSASCDDLIQFSQTLRTAGRDLIAKHLGRLAGLELAWFGVESLSVGRASDERPMLSRHTRAELEIGRPWVSTLRHEAIVPDAHAARLATFLDGARSRSDLIAMYANDTPDRPFTDSLEAALRSLEMQALLEPSSGA